MYQVILKGGFETENADELIAKIDELVNADSNTIRFGQFVIYQLDPMVDYQNADVTNPQDPNSDIS